MLDWSRFEVLTFDCYGTLIDWESGILAALKPVFARHGQMVADEDALALYVRAEPAAERGDFMPYKEVLRRTMTNIAQELDITLTGTQRDALVESLPTWEPFPDTVDALGLLAARYRLGVISNVDDDLFAGTATKLRVTFDPVVTAESVGAYKPSHAMFEAAHARLGVDRSHWLHVAQSRYHDVAPAREFGLETVHVERRSMRRGHGATPAAHVEPSLQVPDLAALAQLVERG